MSDVDVGSWIEPIEPPDDHECEEEAVAKGGDASGRGWGPGWPTNNTPKMTTVRTGGIALSVRAELAPVIEQLVSETVARGYPLHHGQCWGFANRAIRGTRRPSNHSWGLAVDLNAPANPMGDRLVTDMPGWMVELWKSRGFRWGGDYSGRKDAMHFEFLGTPDDARGVAGTAGGPAPAPSPTPAAAPPPPPPAPAPTPATGPVLRRGVKGNDVRRLQQRLGAHGVACAVDGDFGAGTERAVIAFQRARGLGGDGVVGPRTWAALG